MREKQNIEFKEKWDDDYLKWICGFANAIGGSIFIGLDDNGNPVNLSNIKKLMDDIPNKIRNKLGIISDVNLMYDKESEYIEIVTHPYSVPVSYRGRFYYRSGSTKMELTGNSLNDFLLKKSGKTWDDIIEPLASIDDIDITSINQYLSDVAKSGRININPNINLNLLLEKLRLSVNGQLKRSALILFGKDPGKYYPNQVVKIGKFGIDSSDLLFQEVIEGNLIHILNEVIEVLNKRFLNKPISYVGLQRIEKNEYPIAALREMLLNALIHRNYMGTSVKIKVFEDRISFWNEGSLPEGLEISSLKREHSSRPRNPIIADVCFKSGYIDAWGRGTLKIINSCIDSELLEPKFKEVDGGFLVEISKKVFSSFDEKSKNLNERQLEAISYLKNNKQITNSDYKRINNVSKSTATRDINDLLDKKIIMKTGTKGLSAKYQLF